MQTKVLQSSYEALFRGKSWSNSLISTFFYVFNQN